MERHRVWLNLTNDQGFFKQVLIGYITGATNGWDYNYDGVTLDALRAGDFYSINEGTKLVIQGRALPFDPADTVPLGYRILTGGNLTISIDRTDGDLDKQDIYLQDKQTGTIHNLKNGPYTFSTAGGTFNDRFVIRYNDGRQLGTGESQLFSNDFTVASKDKIISLRTVNNTLQEVCVFDITGKLLYTNPKIGASELEISGLQAGTQILLVKTTLDNGATITRKIFF